jgi:hypothetical protein
VGCKVRWGLARQLQTRVSMVDFQPLLLLYHGGIFLLLISCYIFAYIIFDKARLEAMMLSEPNKDCIMEDGTCIWHSKLPMLEIFLVKLAKTPVVNGFVELYGYIAARYLLDPLLKYIINIGRDDPVSWKRYTCRLSLVTSNFLFHRTRPNL